MAGLQSQQVLKGLPSVDIWRFGIKFQAQWGIWIIQDIADRPHARGCEKGRSEPFGTVIPRQLDKSGILHVSQALLAKG